MRVSELYHRDERVTPQPLSIDDLGRLGDRGIDSDKCELRIPDLDLVDFDMPERDRLRHAASGPPAVMSVARGRYGQIRSGQLVDSPRFPKFYARVAPERVVRAIRGENFTREFHDRRRDRQVFGTYTVIQYFFYFLYNDAWNQHQGDWDCQVDLWMKDDRQYMITYHHTSAWATRWPNARSHPTIRTWVNRWQNLGERETGELFRIGNFPFVFLAQGAHGAFPTPGFTLFGLGLPGDDFLSNTDERHIGRTCILPKGFPRSAIRGERSGRARAQARPASCAAGRLR